jgi:hypothetical protein
MSGSGRCLLKLMRPKLVCGKLLLLLLSMMHVGGDRAKMGRMIVTAVVTDLK